MATTTTYLLISGIDDMDAVMDHSVLSEYNLDHQETFEASDRQVSAVRLARKQPLEDGVDLAAPARSLSADVSNATVVLCEVEERFDQVERLRTLVFIGGKKAGDLEHGYIFNIGNG